MVETMCFITGYAGGLRGVGGGGWGGCLFGCCFLLAWMCINESTGEFLREKKRSNADFFFFLFSFSGFFFLVFQTS